MRYGVLFIVVVLFVPLVTVAQTVDCWDFSEFSSVNMADAGSDAVSLLVLPGGAGDSLNQARLLNGTPVDATITLSLRDCWDVPIASFPAEDLWLESADGGLAVCMGGTTADASTNADGITTWSEPLRAGGQSEAGCHIIISGMQLFLGNPLDLRFNSPDLNRDLVVNLTDVVLFIGDFFGVYQPRSDFFRDGVLNLSDVVPMGSAIGSACP